MVILLIFTKPVVASEAFIFSCISQTMRQIFISGWLSAPTFSNNARFIVQQRALAFDTPAIAGQAAIVAHHPVARDRHRQRVGGARPRYRPHRFRRTDPECDLGVACGLTGRNLS